MKYAIMLNEIKASREGSQISNLKRGALLINYKIFETNEFIKKIEKVSKKDN